MEKQHITRKKETKISKTNDSTTEESGTGLLRRTKQVVVQSTVTETEILTNKVDVGQPGTSTGSSGNRCRITMKDVDVIIGDMLAGGDCNTITARTGNIPVGDRQLEETYSREARPKVLSEVPEGNSDSCSNSNENVRIDRSGKFKKGSVGDSNYKNISSDSYEIPSTYFKNMQTKSPLSQKKCVKLGSEVEYYVKDATTSGEESELNKNIDSFRYVSKPEGAHNNVSPPSLNRMKDGTHGKIKCSRESGDGNEKVSVSNGSPFYVTSINHKLSCGTPLASVENAQERTDALGRCSVSDLVNFYENLRNANLKKNKSNKDKMTVTSKPVNFGKNEASSSKRVTTSCSTAPLSNKQARSKTRKRHIKCGTESARKRLGIAKAEIPPLSSNKFHTEGSHLSRPETIMTIESPRKTFNIAKSEIPPLSSNEFHTEPRPETLSSNGKQAYLREHIFIFPDDTMYGPKNEFNASKSPCKSRFTTKNITPKVKDEPFLTERPAYSDTVKKMSDVEFELLGSNNDSTNTLLNSTEDNAAYKFRKPENNRFSKQKGGNVKSLKKEWPFVKTLFFGIVLIYGALSFFDFIKPMFK